ncbi:MAG: recombinase family protein [Methylococcales bacterium]|nr:recombinase family protein [Methylococcales bacterium]
MSKVKCYSYVRYSSELQRLNSSLTRQLEKSKSYADKHNLELITDYQDLGISGYQGNKQDALAKLKLAIANGTIAQGSLILIEEFDRLSRAKPAEAQIQFYELLKSGVNIVTLVDEEVFTWESIEEKPQQLFISLIKSISAHDESKKKSERVRNAWQKKRDAMVNGKPLTKKVPFWISWDDKSNNFVLNDLAISFKLAFKMSIEHGHGSYYISKFLNLNNYPAPVAYSD